MNKPKRKISHANARAKGHNFEREIANYFRMIGFLKAGRQLEYQLNHCNGVDIADSGPFAVQCKSLQKYASIRAIEEIKLKLKIPVLFSKGNGLPPMAVVPLEDFFRLAEAFMRNTSDNFQKENGWTDPVKTDLGF